MIGETYSKLKVVAYTEKKKAHHKLWLCRCECGKEVEVVGVALANETVRSCGCTPPEDLTGRRFDRLVVLRFHNRNKGRWHWLCRCDCGVEKVVQEPALKTGTVRSCGCLKDDVLGVARFRSLEGQKFGDLLVVHRFGPRGRRVYYECLCDCGDRTIVEASSLRGGLTRSCGCRTRRRGSEHPKWKDHLTEKERSDRRSIDSTAYKEWRRAIFERDHFTCLVCGKVGGYKVAHHLDGWGWCTEKRFDADNGVTLCGSPGACHSQFHKIYGKKNNTQDQFEEFLASHKLAIAL